MTCLGGEGFMSSAVRIWAMRLGPCPQQSVGSRSRPLDFARGDTKTGHPVEPSFIKADSMPPQPGRTPS